MDPVLQELLIGLVSNGLTELVARGADDRASAASDAIGETVAGAAGQLTGVEAILPSLGGERLREFLRSAEAHNVVRQIFASTDPKQVDDVEREFYELWRIRMDGEASASAEDVGRLFRSLVDLCNVSLDQAIAAGNLTAAAAKDAQRHAELRGAIESLERSIGMLAGSPAPDLAEIEDYAAKYRRQLAAREGAITPPALDSARQVPIDSLYVPARLEEIERPSLKAPHSPVDYEEFGQGLFRAVVLGNPGSGKSTLAKKLAADVARDQLTLGQRPAGMVPFLIVLRDYGARKRDDPCSIVDFIASTSNSRYQLTPPDTAIEYLLLTNRAMVIFDGLDELLDTSYRAEISGDVESFASLYPSMPILVTSREVGYQQAPLSPDTFTAFRLASFAEQQVQQYARNWFAIDEAPAEANDRASSFMVDSDSVSDLRSNALMLGLMCNLYKGSGYIPRNRPDVYEACAEMLFDRWDRLRQIGKPLNIESLLRPAMQHLAAWIYADGELQSGVSERALIASTTDFLIDRRFETREEAELEARRFIEFCRGRAWVFTDIGTTPKGERLYQFTHRTFLEFFTAGHLVRTNPSPERLLAVLEPYISVREWDVVAQLAFQLLDHNVDGAADVLLTELASERIDPEDGPRVNRLDFAVRSLEFLVPSPAVTKMLVARATDLCMRFATQGDAGRGMDAVAPLLAANPENTGAIRDAFVEGIRGHLEDPEVARYAAELGLEIRPERGHSEGWRFAESIAAQVSEAHRDLLREIARGDQWVATDLLVAGGLDAGQCAADHGLEPFLAERPYSMFPGSGRISLGELFVSSLLWESTNRLSQDFCLRCVAALAPYLTPDETASASRVHESWLNSYAEERLEPSRIAAADLSEDQRYAILVLLIVFLDASPNREPDDLPIGISPLAMTLAPILRRDDAETASAALRELGLSEPQLEVLLGWVEGTVALSPRR